MGNTMGFDMSMRSSGMVVIDKENNLLSYDIIKTEQEDYLFEEDLIDYISHKVLTSIYDYEVDQFAIEGLSLNAKNPQMDVIAGIYWGIRTILHRNYGDEVLIGSIPVKSWRSKVLPAKEAKELKKTCRDHLKNGVVMKLPDVVYDKFLKFVAEKEYKAESIFDLSDAYFIALYRNSLNI